MQTVKVVLMKFQMAMRTLWNLTKDNPYYIIAKNINSFCMPMELLLYVQPMGNLESTEAVVSVG
jgi:hypothetical protein